MTAEAVAYRYGPNQGCPSARQGEPMFDGLSRFRRPAMLDGTDREERRGAQPITTVKGVCVVHNASA